MSNYVYRSNLSYFDYLQAKSFEKSIRYEIKESTRSIIASHEELHSENFEIICNFSKNIEQLSFVMEGIADEIKELTSIFEWGFSEVLSKLGHINDSLQELIKIAKTPSQTWAYEQFEIARDAYRQCLYEEALEYLSHAINGHGTYTGYKLEYRFHFLLGTIRLGSFQNNSESIINLDGAKKAFLISAKYARTDKPTEAGRAFLCAGWVAYCQGNMEEAQEYTQQAITLYPVLGETHYQMAKILMHCGEPDKALISLKQAIEFDRNYSLKAGADDDFKKYNEKLNSLILKLYKEMLEKTKRALSILEKELSNLEKFHVNELSIQQYVDIEKIKILYKKSIESSSLDTYFGCTDAFAKIMQINAKIKESKRKFLDFAIADIKQKIASIDKKSNTELNDLDCIFILILFFGIPLCAILSVILPLMEEKILFFGCLKGSALIIILTCIMWVACRIRKTSYLKQLKLKLPKLLCDLQRE